MNVVLSPEAVADLERLRAFLTEVSPAAAERVAQTLAMAIGSLADMPGRGRPLQSIDLRELIVPFGGSAYVVRYAVREARGEIVIIRVWHGREERS